MSDPKADFRYKMPDGTEVEAYQVTARSRWQDREWPPWLQKQTIAGEMNRVYTDPSDANTLFIELPSGRYGIERDAWIISDGSGLSVCNAEQFHAEGKVVPLAPKAVNPPADGHDSDAEFAKVAPNDPHLKVTGAPPAAIAAVVPDIGPSSITYTTSDSMEVIKDAVLLMYKDRDGAAASDSAYELLIDHISAHTHWCDCNPGQCAEGDQWSCREKSPLLRGGK